MYLAGIKEDEIQSLQDILQVPTGRFSFRYLGVPLHSRKLFYNEYKPVFNKVVARAKTWIAKKLSYDGRTQLISSVLQGIQSYLCHIFLLPKKVLKEI